MQVAPSTQLKWTIHDLELFPEDSKRYEIIAGELHVTRAPHWQHQKICVAIAGILHTWSSETGLGEAAITPGVIFSETDSVIPDVVWVGQTRLAEILDDSGHLTAAPELVVEVLSQGSQNQKRDRELKLKLYSNYGVQEYWLVDRFKQQVEIYRREAAI
ncbi:MAG: Uma2 family endonuclease, partial [Cyanobacteria bacterium P01_H01_bin.121]